MDNVGVNDAFMHAMETGCIKVNINASTVHNRVRCLAYILNLSVQDILKSLNIALVFQLVMGKFWTLQTSIISMFRVIISLAFS